MPYTVTEVWKNDHTDEQRRIFQYYEFELFESNLIIPATTTTTNVEETLGNNTVVSTPVVQHIFATFNNVANEDSSVTTHSISRTFATEDVANSWVAFISNLDPISTTVVSS
jgi:hypothetical protein